MKHKIRPADEEFTNCIPSLAFSVLWYVSIGKQLIQTFDPSLLLFIIAGLLPLYVGVQSIRKALFYRNQRAQAIARGHAVHGRITGVVRKMIPYSGKNGRLRFQKYYYLQVELYSAVNGTMQVIESQAYRRPIHRYIAAPQVMVYTDSSGFRHYIEEIQWKTSRKQPDILPYPPDFDETQSNFPFFQVIFVLIVVGMLLKALL